MTYEEYHQIFVLCLIGAQVMLWTSGFLFLFLHVRQIIGNLTGASARKEIARIQQRSVAAADGDRKLLDMDGRLQEFRLEKEIVYVHTEERI